MSLIKTRSIIQQVQNKKVSCKSYIGFETLNQFAVYNNKIVKRFKIGEEIKKGMYKNFKIIKINSYRDYVIIHKNYCMKLKVDKSLISFEKDHLIIQISEYLKESKQGISLHKYSNFSQFIKINSEGIFINDCKLDNQQVFTLFKKANEESSYEKLIYCIQNKKIKFFKMNDLNDEIEKNGYYYFRNFKVKKKHIQSIIKGKDIKVIFTRHKFYLLKNDLLIKNISLNKKQRELVRKNYYSSSYSVKQFHQFNFIESTNELFLMYTKHGNYEVLDLNTSNIYNLKGNTELYITGIKDPIEIRKRIKIAYVKGKI